MRAHFIDRYSRQDSCVHSLAVEAKLFLSISLILTATLCPPSLWPLLVAAIIALLAWCFAANIPLRFLLAQWSLLWLLAACISTLALFQTDGILKFAWLLLRSALSTLSVLTLINTTPFDSILHTLRRWRAPTLLLSTLTLMYRYIFLLMDEALRLKHARAARMLKPSRRELWQLMHSLLAALFIRSLERAQRIYAAMCARGWKA